MFFSPMRSGVKLDVEPWLETYRPVYAHMRDHAARGRPVSTITGRLQPYRGEATGRPPKFVPLEVGKARR